MHPIRSLLLTAAVLLALPMAADASTLKLAGGVLTYTDTATNVNDVTIALSGDGTRITVAEAGRTSRNRAITVSSDGTCAASGSSGSCAAASVKSIAVDTGPSADKVVQTTSLPSKLAGGAGDDSLSGGAGDDTFPRDAGADTLLGGGGSDTVDYSAVATAVTVSLDGNPGDGPAGENDNVQPDVENATGGSADDTLNGNDAANQLRGGAGNDSLSGGGDDDRLTGDDGDDSLAADAGNDVLEGGAGADALIGGEGFDRAEYLSSAAGVRITLDTRAGDGAPGENDNVQTEAVLGSPYDDVLVGDGGANLLQGGGGNDRILGGRGADALYGNHGDDILQTLDGVKDLVACGDGEDGVVTDRRDQRSDCDYIKYRPFAASATALHISRGAVRIPGRCSPATALGCNSRITLEAGNRTLGTLRFRLAPGRRWVAKVKLTRKGRAYVGRRRLTTASMVISDRDATGALTRSRQTIRLAR